MRQANLTVGRSVALPACALLAVGMLGCQGTATPTGTPETGISSSDGPDTVNDPGTENDDLWLTIGGDGSEQQDGWTDKGQAPRARAGADISVKELSLIRLDGSLSSDPDGDQLSFKWLQKTGPVVSLMNGSSVKPSFAAPDVDQDTALTFSLAVSDGTNLDQDEVTVQVLDVSEPVLVECPVVFDVQIEGAKPSTPLEGPAPLTVICEVVPAEGEKPPEGTYAWVIDGVEDSGPPTTHAELTHVFSGVGTHTGAFRLTPSGGNFPLACASTTDGASEVVVTVTQDSTPCTDCSGESPPAQQSSPGGFQAQIHFATHTTGEVRHFRADGTTETLTDPIDVRDFLGDKVDLSIYGVIAGSQHITDSPLFDGIWLSQFGMTSIRESASNPLWQLVEDEEDVFLHAAGQPYTAENRLLWTCGQDSLGRESYQIYPAPAWGNAIGTAMGEQLQEDPQLDGVFADNTWSLLQFGVYVRRIEDEEHAAAGQIIYTDFPVYVPNGPWLCENDIAVRGQDGLPLLVTDYDSERIVLAGSAPAEGTLYVSYYSPADPDASLGDTWNSDMVQTLQALRAAVGSKLVLYNGVLAGLVDDDAFINIVDGGMEEQWARATDSETKWKQNIDELIRFGELNKIFLAQSYATDPTRPAMFAFTSFLLGANEYGYFDFAQNTQTFLYYDYWSQDLGEPLATYTVQPSGGGNVYRRDFTNAVVLVNPAMNDVGMNMDTTPFAAYWNSSGVYAPEQPSGKIQLPGQSGMILIKTP
jgi:hypothetical protein